MPYNLSQLTAEGYQLGYVGEYQGGVTEPPSVYTINITGLFPADSNSLLAGQGWAVSDEPVYMREPGLPYLVENGVAVSPAVHMAYKAPYTSLVDVATAGLLSNDINDYMQAPVGVEGSFRWDLERELADGTVVQWSPTITVADEVVAEPTLTSIGTVIDGSQAVAFAGTNLQGAAVHLVSTLYSQQQSGVAIVGGGGSGMFAVVRGNVPFESASHDSQVIIETADGSASIDSVFNPAAGFAVAEMGATVSVMQRSLWYQHTGNTPVAGFQAMYPLVSRLGGAVSVDSEGVPTIDYTGVPNAENIGTDWLDGVELWDGSWSQPFSKSVLNPLANQAPILSAIAARSLAVGSVEVIQLYAADPEGGTMEFSIDALHAGTGVSVSGSALILAPNNADLEASPISITVRVADEFGASDSETFLLTVLPFSQNNTVARSGVVRSIIRNPL